MKQKIRKVWKKRKRLIIGIFVVLGLIYGAYSWWKKPKVKPAAASYSVIEQVTRGDVYTGIKANGKIVVANKLDLDVYKKDIRINKVSIKNGSRVKKGDLLLSFEKDDLQQSLTSASLAVQNARFSLEDEQIKSIRQDTELDTTEDLLSDVQKDIADYQKTLDRARYDYYSNNMKIEPADGEEDRLELVEKPTITGIYTGPKAEYLIEVYSSNTSSGKSFRFSGPEDGADSVYKGGQKTSFGKYGLSVVFPNGTRSGDKWKIVIPSVETEQEKRAEDDYHEKIRQIKKSYEKNILTEKNLKNDALLYGEKQKRPLAQMRVQESRLALSRARETYKNIQKQIAERTIIAPFDGVITGMKNVVVGTKPGSDSATVVKLGNLVSDSYLIEFSLSLADLSKIKEGQSVNVNIPSRMDISSIRAEISEISILPNGSGLAQYDVKAIIDPTTVPDDFQLREGVSADIEVINSEKKDVLRVPKAAVRYENGNPFVLRVLDNDKKDVELADDGIVNLNDSQLQTEKINLELGLKGKNYDELVSGLEEGNRIVSTVSAGGEVSLFGEPDVSAEYDEEMI